jgi:hypothetical protein
MKRALPEDYTDMQSKCLIHENLQSAIQIVTQVMQICNQDDHIIRLSQLPRRDFSAHNCFDHRKSLSS